MFLSSRVTRKKRKKIKNQRPDKDRARVQVRVEINAAAKTETVATEAVVEAVIENRRLIVMPARENSRPVNSQNLRRIRIGQIRTRQRRKGIRLQIRKILPSQVLSQAVVDVVAVIDQKVMSRKLQM